MIALYIIGAFLLVILLVLVMPIKLKVSFLGDFDYVVSFGPFRLISSKTKKKLNSNKKNELNDDEQDGFFKKLYKEKGFSGTVLEVFSYLKIIFSEMGYFFSKIKIRDFLCCVTVSSFDAAETAITYGTVSAAVHGFTAFLNNCADFKYKKILVNADYDAKTSSFELKFTIKIKMLYLLITAYKLFDKFIKNKREV